MSAMKTLGFIGGGRITRILLNGFKNAHVSFEEINVYDTSESVLKALRDDYPHIETSFTDFSGAASSGWVFIALHPPVFMETLDTIKNYIRNDALVISLAPKITIDKIKSVLPGVPNIIRMNPNAGTYVNRGYNPVTYDNNADKSVVSEFLEELDKTGKAPVVPENQLEGYAMISAMGHTYFWYQLQQLKELGLSYGMSDKELNDTISEMLVGTTETLFNSGLEYAKVVDLVPVKPMAEHEDTIRDFYKNRLNGLYQKIKPQ